MTPDPSTHFIDADSRPHPLWVRRDTGAPEWADVDGRLVPYAEYAASRPAPAGIIPSGFKAEGAGFSFGLSVTNPGA